LFIYISVELGEVEDEIFKKRRQTEVKFIFIKDQIIV